MAAAPSSWRPFSGHSDRNAPVLTITGGSSLSQHTHNGAGGAAAASGTLLSSDADDEGGCRGLSPTQPSIASPLGTIQLEGHPNDRDNIRFTASGDDTVNISPVDSLAVPTPTTNGDGASSTAGATASTVGKSVAAASIVAASVSPVLSRDFATLIHSKTRDGKVAHTEGWIAHQASPDGAETKPVIHPAPVTVLPADVLPTAGPSAPGRGRPSAISAPRLQTLKNLVRASSEPNLPRVDREKLDPNDPEKGAAEVPVAVAAGGAASEPNLPRNPRLVALLEPEKPLKPPPTWKTSAINIAKYSYLNILLVLYAATLSAAAAPTG